jgi:hypothetical protein
MFAVDRNQNTTEDGSTFGYVFVGEGGVFFTWRYDATAPLREQIRQVVATAEEDSVDPPTGRWSWAGVERAILAHIRQHGMYLNTAR